MVKKGIVYSWLIVYKCSKETNPAEKWGRVGELPESLELHFSQCGDMTKSRKWNLFACCHLVCQPIASWAVKFQNFNGFAIKIYSSGTDM